MQTVCPAVCRLLTAHCDPLVGVWVITAVLGQLPAWVPCCWCGWAEDAATRHHHPRGRGETRRRARRSVTTLQLGFLPRLSRDCDIVLVFAAAVAGDCLAYDGGRVRTGGNTAHHKPDDSH